MKQKTKILLSMVATLPLLFFGTTLVQAQSDHSDASDHTDAQTGSDQSSDRTSTLEQRLETRKQALQTRLDAAQRLAIQARCQASQGHLRRLASRILGITVSQEKVYDNLISRLVDLSQQLQAKGIDTTDFDNQINELETKISAFYTALDAYEQAVNDLATMDCAADPEGYKASLEDARKLRAEVVQAGEDIKSYLRDTIKPTLQNIRSQIADATDTEESQ